VWVDAPATFASEVAIDVRRELGGSLVAMSSSVRCAMNFVGDKEAQPAESRPT
jgi:hypothetical protein